MTDRTPQPERPDSQEPSLAAQEPRHDPRTERLVEPRTDAAAVAADAADAADATDVTPVRRGIRVRTVVFGVVMLVISIVSLVVLTTGVRVDGAAIGLTLLLGAGAVLVAGGAASAVREAQGGPGAGR